MANDNYIIKYFEKEKFNLNVSNQNTFPTLFNMLKIESNYNINNFIIYNILIKKKNILSVKEIYEILDDFPNKSINNFLDELHSYTKNDIIYCDYIINDKKFEQF